MAATAESVDVAGRHPLLLVDACPTHRFAGGPDLRNLGDVDRGAFEEVPNEVLAAVMSVFRKDRSPAGVVSVATQPTPLSDKSYDRERTKRKRATVLAQVGRFEFETRDLQAVEGCPVVYWWDKEFRDSYASSTKLGDQAGIREGLGTKNDPRYLRMWWEVRLANTMLQEFAPDLAWDGSQWVPFIKGADGRQWFDAVMDVVNWRHAGIEIATYAKSRFGRGATLYFRQGIAFVMIGSGFGARAHRFPSIFGHMGGSAFPVSIASTLCSLNATRSKDIAEALNPSLHFLVGDVNRLPIFPVESADDIYRTLDRAFTEHERARENSVEYLAPGPSPWDYAQTWAQRAVDRPAGEPLPAYQPAYVYPEPIAFVSHAVGLALGRFPLNRTDQQGTLPAGILYVSATERDSLADPACAPILAAWAERGAAVDPRLDVRAWLRTRFFDHHRKLYENRPIYFPLSSAKRSFVAWVSIHRWTESTLSTLLADHLLPELLALDGQIDDLRKARASADGKARTAANTRFDIVQKLRDELCAFVDVVTACAEKGPPPPGATAERERDARYVPDLDDGVMVNSAALWPLLEAQWKDPKKWWKELVTAGGAKDYDWSHLAARYFPARVDDKCRRDPSLAVAHGCFWKYHPARAYAWELRLQDEIAPDFRIEESGAAEVRKQYLREHAAEAREIEKAEQKRRERKAKKARLEAGPDQGELFEDEVDGGEASEGEASEDD